MRKPAITSRIYSFKQFQLKTTTLEHEFHDLIYITLGKLALRVPMRFVRLAQL